MVSHESVLLAEALEWLAPTTGKCYVDGTLGAGGHARAVLEKNGPTGRLIGFDRDEEALALAGKNLKEFGERAMLIHDDFKNIANQVRAIRDKGVDGALLDLGVSSMQLDQPLRGFSFQADAPLDMRMDQRQSLTAKEIVNLYSKDELLNILWTLGEERFARRIVTKILDRRTRTPLATTGELAALISDAVPGHYRHGRIHPATRTFQALRIAVNHELDSLEAFLSSVMSILENRARVVIISFHSLEDRIVKHTFRAWSAQGLGVILTKKPVTASESEMARNTRARSAKLRVFEKNIEAGA
jgi:16S rRNA (cytosine1402-N4)-methyltransferase